MDKTIPTSKKIDVFLFSILISVGLHLSLLISFPSKEPSKEVEKNSNVRIHFKEIKAGQRLKTEDKRTEREAAEHVLRSSNYDLSLAYSKAANVTGGYYLGQAIARITVHADGTVKSVTLHFKAKKPNPILIREIEAVLLKLSFRPPLDHELVINWPIQFSGEG